MLSIIICSRKNHISSELKQNIAETIGCEYELVIVDNSKNQYSIFQAYNEGVRKSKGEALCFMHEDVLYKTNNWGEMICDLFRDESIGLIGVLGGHAMPAMPASWITLNYKSGQIINPDRQSYYGRRQQGMKCIDVVCVDGLMMCMRRSLFDCIRFDDETFGGFHCYDTDICMQVWQQRYRVVVIYDVFVEHKSFGIHNDEYFKSIDLFYEKWKNSLPLIKGIDIPDYDYEERLMLAVYGEEGAELRRLRKIPESNAYKIGKAILAPFRWCKRIIKIKFKNK